MKTKEEPEPYMSPTVTDSGRERSMTIASPQAPTRMPGPARTSGPGHGPAAGAVFLGSLATAHRLAPPARRAHAISAYFVACYCGLTIPVVGVGIAAGFIGYFPAVLALSILLAALCVLALSGIARALTSDTAAVSR
jgi:hypothetical protein